MLTSSEAPEDVCHALAAGACGYVTKTVRRAEAVARDFERGLLKA